MVVDGAIEIEADTYKEDATRRNLTIRTPGVMVLTDWYSFHPRVISVSED
jgi:hypothetical protein